MTWKKTFNYDDTNLKKIICSSFLLKNTRSICRNVKFVSKYAMVTNFCRQRLREVVVVTVDPLFRKSLRILSHFLRWDKTGCSNRWGNIPDVVILAKSDDNDEEEDNNDHAWWRRWKMYWSCHLVVLDDDVVGALCLLKLARPGNTHRCEGQLRFR